MEQENEQGSGDQREEKVEQQHAYYGEQREHEAGWDTDVKQYFVDILKAISWGLIWMIFGVTLGLYQELAFGKPLWASVLFYVFQAVTLILLIRYYRNMWGKNRFNESRTAEDVDDVP